MQLQETMLQHTPIDANDSKAQKNAGKNSSPVTSVQDWMRKRPWRDWQQDRLCCAHVHEPSTADCCYRTAAVGASL
jgi:hypothetical protein